MRPPDLDKLLVRIRDSRLSRPDVEVVTTQILSENPRAVAAVLFHALNHEPGEELITNVLDLFSQLVLRSPRWVRLLDKSIRKKGRCPKRLMPRIRGLLQNESSRIAGSVRSVRELLSDLEVVAGEWSDIPPVGSVAIERKKSYFRRDKTVATVPITTDLTDITHMEAVASIIQKMDPLPHEVVFDFCNVGHVYVVGLGALAAWCARNGITPQIANAPDSTERYLDVIGFNRAFHGGISPYTEADPTQALAIERLGPEAPPETVAVKLVDIVDHHMHLSAKSRTGLIVVFAELVENINRHAESPLVAFACAQVYPKKHKLTICVVDTGIGIKQSIMKSSNGRLIERVADGESAVYLACCPLVTSKPDRHSGYGLYVASELVVRNGGTFRIFSGNEIFTCYRKGWRRMEHTSNVTDAWDGTWISMILDLDAALSVEDVYTTLPAIPGAELQDFFER
jgi:anti-sigma regulatory factor (Ser/Thr protein kinase)